MELTEEQIKYVKEHLRDKEKEQRVAEILGMIVKESNKYGLDFDMKDATMIAMLMNIGETHSDIKHIYDKDFS